MEAQEREERGEQDGRRRQHEQPLVAHRGHAQIEDAAHLGRHPQVVAPRDRQQARLEERGQAERQHEVERPLRPPPEPSLERRDQERVDAEAEQERPHGCSQHAHGARKMQEHDRGEGQVAADREELPVRHVDDVEHAEDQAEPDREQRVEPAQDQALDQELEEGFEHQASSSSPK